MTQDQWMKEAERLAMDFAHCYAFVGDDTMPKAKAALLAHLQQRLPVREEGVLVLLKRPEGYEDVHPELLLQDANINPAFEPEIVSRPLPVREEPTPEQKGEQR